MIRPSGPESLWYVPMDRNLYMSQSSGIFMICSSGPASSWYARWSGIFMICPSGTAFSWYAPVVRHLYDMSQCSDVHTDKSSFHTNHHHTTLPASISSLLARQQFCTTNTSFSRQEIHLQTSSYSHYRKDLRLHYKDRTVNAISGEGGIAVYFTHRKNT